jgi:hypothetical protein
MEEYRLEHSTSEFIMMCQITGLFEIVNLG